MSMYQIVPNLRRFGSAAVGAMAILASGGALADSISPTSFSASLGIGDSVTVHKTVTITKAPPTSALIDVMFVFDTTGSMSTGIAGAKSMATGLLTSLGSYGSVASGVAYYNDPGAGVLSTINTNAAATQAMINTLGASGGGDFAELGYAGITAAANSASWRPGSNRFIVALGDAGFKPTSAIASTIAAIGTANADLIGIFFNTGGSDTPTFGSSITGLGGTSTASSTNPADIAAAIAAGIAAGFEKYSKVTVDDLGAGLPGIDVSTVCTAADIGSCSGADATGAYDRSVDRTFEFDVTFKRLAAGDTAFATDALADGSIVASEADRFGTTIPEPDTLALMAISLVGLGGIARRRLS